MAFASLRSVLSGWLKKRNLEKFFDENKILEITSTYVKEQKKRVKSTSRRKNSAREN